MIGLYLSGGDFLVLMLGFSYFYGGMKKSHSVESGSMMS